MSGHHRELPVLTPSCPTRRASRLARRACTLFQRGLTAAEAAEAGTSLGYAATFPGFTVVAPDLRSERRSDRVMGDAGWANFEAALGAGGDGDRQIGRAHV